MIVVMKPSATQREIREVKRRIEKKGLKAVVSSGTERTVVGAIGDERILSQDELLALSGVEKVAPILKKFKIASREFHAENSVIKIDSVEFGNKKVQVIAGPCSVETQTQTLKTAEEVKKSGASVLKASLFKPRTSPYDFQGLGFEGIKILKKVRQEINLPVETEVMHPNDVRRLERDVDALRVGARNMQNYDLLRELGKSKKPVILKNGLSSTINEFLMSAEYILGHGNPNVILCIRGIRTFETETRFTLDLSAVPVLKALTHLPVIVDPSHAAGKRELVAPLAKAAVAVGADGLMVEVHPHPEKALSDPLQQLTPSAFNSLMKELKPVAEAVGREI